MAFRGFDAHPEKIHRLAGGGEGETGIGQNDNADTDENDGDDGFGVHNR